MAGILIGGMASAAILALAGSLEGAIFRTPNWPLNVGLIAVFMIVVGMVACAGPTLKAIRIQPVEALKG